MKPILLRGHEKPISVVKFNFDGDLLFTGAKEKRVNLWYSLSGERIGSYETKAAVLTLDVTNDSSILTVGTAVGSLEFFKVEDGTRLGMINFDAKLLSVQFSYGDKQLVVLAEYYSKDKVGTTEFLIFDFEKIKAAFKPSKETVDVKPEKIMTFKKKFSQISWGPLNENIYAAGIDGVLEIINLDGKEGKSVQAHEDQITSIAFSKEYAFLSTASSDGVKIWDPSTLELVKNFKTEVPMNAASFSPLIFDKKKPKYHAIIAGGVMARDAAKHKMGGFEIRLCNLTQEEEIGKIAGHFGPVNALAFYPDGRGFVSGGEEGIIRLFRFDKKYFDDFE